MSQKRSYNRGHYVSRRNVEEVSFNNVDDNDTSPPLLTLRVAGLGHHFEVTMESTATLLQLKQKIESHTDIPPEYQRLVAKRKIMDNDSMVLGGRIYTVAESDALNNSCNNNPNSTNTGSVTHQTGIGLENRAKILLLYSSQYAADKDGVEKLTSLLQQINDVDVKRSTRDIENQEVHELITQLCCRIDEVETHGSEALRKMRKMAVIRAEMVAKKSDESKRGIDP